MANIHKKQAGQNNRRPLAIFDLDHTLINGDSEAMWSRFLFEKGVVDKDFLLRITSYYHAYESGHLDIYEYEAFLLQPLANYPLPQITEWRAEFLQQVQQAIRPELAEQVVNFRELEFILVLITASNSFIAEPIAKLLNFPNLICTQIKKENGRFTTQIDRIPAFQDGKVQRLKNWLSKHNLTLEGSWGYSDSHNDLPLLRLVKNPIAVFPDPILRAYANQHGWQIISQESG